jgi:hypothetical protein
LPNSIQVLLEISLLHGFSSANRTTKETERREFFSLVYSTN